MAIPVQIAFRKAIEQTGRLAMNSAALDWAIKERFEQGTRASLDAIPETSESTFVINEQHVKFGARLALTSVNTWELLGMYCLLFEKKIVFARFVFCAAQRYKNEKDAVLLLHCSTNRFVCASSHWNCFLEFVRRKLRHQISDKIKF